MLLLVGFTEEEIRVIKKRIREKIMVLREGDKDRVLEDIIKSESSRGARRLGEDRFVIMHDVPRERISEVMRGLREIVPFHIIFATTTPTSLQWKLNELLQELKEEDLYFSRQRGENV